MAVATGPAESTVPAPRGGGPAPRPVDILIIGPPRSGTTLLAALLSGGQTLAVSEPHLTHCVMPDWKLVRLYRRMARELGATQRLPRPPSGTRVRPILRHARALADACGAPQLVVKETFRAGALPGAWLNPPALDEALELSTRVIAIVRDPCDTAASTVRLAAWATGWRGRLVRLRWRVLPLFRDASHVVAWAADNWVAYHAWLKSHAITPLRYEDLVRDPVAALRPLLADDQLAALIERQAQPGDMQARVVGIGDMPTLRRPQSPHLAALGRGGALTAAQRDLVLRVTRQCD